MKISKNAIIAVAAVMGLGAVLVLSDRPVQTRDGAILPRSGAEYTKLMRESSDLALEVFAKADQGLELTAEDKDKIAQALPKFEAMRAYDATQVSATFGEGKCLMLLGRSEEAAIRLAQAYENRNTDTDKMNDAVRLTAIEAAGLSSECYFELAAEELGLANSAEAQGNKTEAEEIRKRAGIYYSRAFGLANEAVTQVPTAPRYLAARGQALIAIGDKEKAKADLAAAEKLAPDHFKVKLLAGLLK